MKSVIEYFQEIYDYTSPYPHLPCLQVGNQRKVNYLPMEACKIVEGQRYTKGLDEKQITSLLKVSCQRPRDQEMEILQILLSSVCIQFTILDTKMILTQRSLGSAYIDSKLASVEARVLPAPWLKYNDAGKVKEFLPQVGQWNMTNKKVINGAP